MSSNRSAHLFMENWKKMPLWVKVRFYLKISPEYNPTHSIKIINIIKFHIIEKFNLENLWIYDLKKIVI